MAQKWLIDIINPPEECFGGQHAFYLQAQPQLKIEADNIGAIGNNITLVNNTTDNITIQELIDEWNSNNPDNTITQTAGLPTYEVAPSESISLGGGINQICVTPEYDYFNTKEDEEVLNGLFNGRNAHRQKHDVHTIKSIKFFDKL